MDEGKFSRVPRVLLTNTSSDHPFLFLSISLLKGQLVSATLESCSEGELLIKLSTLFFLT